MTASNTSKLDRLGVAASVVCLVQCLMAPILLLLIPSLGGSLLYDGELFHRLLAAVVVPLSGIAFFLGCRRHRRKRVIIPGVLGLAAVVTAAVLGYRILGVAGEMAMTLAGVALLTVAHVLNYRLCRRPEVCDHHAVDHSL